MFKQGIKHSTGVLLAGLLWMGVALAQPVHVEGAWARATVPGQAVGGVYMTLTAAQDQWLLGGTSPAAGHVEVHEMAMQDNVMRMRAIESLHLPAGAPTTLKPGGLHLMLVDLKAPLAAGSNVALTLRLRDAQGRESSVPLEIPVRAVQAPANAAGHGGGHGH